MSLQRLLSPRSIAFIGGHWARTAAQKSVAAGFDGTLYVVNPRLTAVDGCVAVASVADLPAPPDAAFVAVNRHETVKVVGVLSAMGCGGAVCFAAGFDEAGEHALTQALCEAAGDMPFLGPNCYGLLNYADGALLWPDEHGGVRLRAGERGVAILSQSGNVAISMTMQRRGLPIAMMCAIGNQTRVGFAELSAALIDDERISAIGWLMESPDDNSKLERLLAKARGKKPVVVYKLGASARGAEIALSHTASLSGDDAAADVFFHHCGVARARTLPQFLETLKLLHLHGALPGRAVLTMSCSGGEAAMVADAAMHRRLSLRPFSDAARQAINAVLGDLVVVQNPFDYHTFVWGDAERMQQAYAAALADGYDLSLLLLDFPRPDRCDDADWRVALQAFITAAKQCPRAAGVVATLPENISEELMQVAHDAGVGVFLTIEDALCAAEHAADIGEHWRAAPPPPLLNAARAPMDADAVPQVLDEHAAKRRLADVGVPVPAGVVVEAASFCTVADAIRNAGLRYPLAVKRLGLAHKSEHDALRLSCADVEAVQAAEVEIGDGNPDTRFLIEEMVDGCVAELIVGIRRDALAGLVLTIGAGGIYTEVLRDCARLALPTTEAAIAPALSSLAAAPLWRGYRGRTAADESAAVAAIMAIAAFAVNNAAQLLELEVNPLMLCPTRAVAADALLVLRD